MYIIVWFCKLLFDWLIISKVRVLVFPAINRYSEIICIIEQRLECYSSILITSSAKESNSCDVLSKKNLLLKMTSGSISNVKK